MLQITSVEPVYDQYGHLVAMTIKVRNAGERPIKATLVAHVVRVVSRGRFSRREEHGSSEPVSLDLPPGGEHTVEMVIHPAISVSREFTISVSGSVVEVATA
ncbi:hypothetical protein DRO33_03415 [Candidatus Bathyarchaeota archaeon]|nr:MAG: hypothetical protein DRO33_03415 [Candidatus Bathyarchaeota archaeon]